jgi:pyruvate kinase
MGADWVALSFVQRPEDIEELKALVAGRAWVMAKLEKPAAIESLDAIIAVSDGVMVARGDLGVERAPEDVPVLQKRIIRACRELGKPVVVATQMLESMISSPVPTRAEVSDVAGAIYDGVDAVMLSAESASGQYPVDAVSMMDRILQATERDPLQRVTMQAVQSYRADQDWFARFVEDMGYSVDKNNPAYIIKSSVLNDDYRDWCRDEHELQLSSKALANELTRRGFENFKSGVKSWRGIEKPVPQGPGGFVR